MALNIVRHGGTRRTHAPVSNRWVCETEPLRRKTLVRNIVEESLDTRKNPDRFDLARCALDRSRRSVEVSVSSYTGRSEVARYTRDEIPGKIYEGQGRRARGHVASQPASQPAIHPTFSIGRAAVYARLVSTEPRRTGFVRELGSVHLRPFVKQNRVLYTLFKVQEPVRSVCTAETSATNGTRDPFSFSIDVLLNWAAGPLESTKLGPFQRARTEGAEGKQRTGNRRSAHDVLTSQWPSRKLVEGRSRGASGEQPRAVP